MWQICSPSNGDLFLEKQSRTNSFVKKKMKIYLFVLNACGDDIKPHFIKECQFHIRNITKSVDF